MTVMSSTPNRAAGLTRGLPCPAHAEPDEDPVTERIQQLVKAAPLTPEQVARLRGLLSPYPEG
jgi:hypothetical protein